MERGSLKVRCSQCRHQWTANVSSALTYDGSPLLSAQNQQAGSEDEEKDEKTALVKLYISGLGPKIDNDALTFSTCADN